LKAKSLTHRGAVERPPPGVIARILIVLGARLGGGERSRVANIHVTSEETLLED